MVYRSTVAITWSTGRRCLHGVCIYLTIWCLFVYYLYCTRSNRSTILMSLYGVYYIYCTLYTMTTAQVHMSTILGILWLRYCTYNFYCTGPTKPTVRGLQCLQYWVYQFLRSGATSTMSTVLGLLCGVYKSTVLDLSVLGLGLLHWIYCTGSTMSPAVGLQRLLY